MTDQKPQQQPQVDDKDKQQDHQDGPQNQDNQQDPQENQDDPGQPQWDLTEQELQMLEQIQQEIQYTQQIAEQVQDEANQGDPTITRARNTLNTVNNVVEVMKDDQNLKEVDEELKFAIDNTLIQLQIKNRRLEKEKEDLRQVLMDRNEKIRYLIDKVNVQEKRLEQQQNELDRLRQQMQYQDKNINRLQEKVDDEYRTKLIQEQLRNVNQPGSVAQKQFKQMSQKEQSMEIPLYIKADNDSRFVDGNLKDQQYNFWMNENDQQMEYPGDPKRLHDVVNQKNLWMGKIEDDKLQRFQYQKGQKVGENKNRQQKQQDDQFWGS